MDFKDESTAVSAVKKQAEEQLKQIQTQLAIDIKQLKKTVQDIQLTSLRAMKESIEQAFKNEAWNNLTELRNQELHMQQQAEQNIQSPLTPNAPVQPYYPVSDADMLAESKALAEKALQASELSVKTALDNSMPPPNAVK